MNWLQAILYVVACGHVCFAAYNAHIGDNKQEDTSLLWAIATGILALPLK